MKRLKIDKHSILFKISMYMLIVIIQSTLILGYMTYDKDFRDQNNSINKEINMQMDSVQNIILQYNNSLQIENSKIINDKKQQLKNYVDIQYNILENKYNQYLKYINEHSNLSDESKEQVKEEYIKKQFQIIKDLTNGTQYIFIFNDKGVMLLHPETSLIGKNLYTLQDEKGNYIFQNLIKQQEDKSNHFTEYYWKKHSDDQNPTLKLTYSIYLKQWNMIIQSGVYMDDVQKQIIKKDNELFQQMRNNVLKIIPFKNSYPIIIEKKNNQLYFKIYYNKQVEGKQFPYLDKANNPLGKQIIGDKGKINYKWTGLNGDTNLYIKTLWYSFIPKMNWYITFQIYDKDVYQPILNGIYFQIFTVQIFFLVLYFIIIFIFFKYVGQPIKELPSILQKFSSGDLTINIQEVDKKDEISQMINSIHKQLKSIQESIKQIKNKKDKINKQNTNISESISNTILSGNKINELINQTNSDIQNTSQNVEEINQSHEEFTQNLQSIQTQTNNIKEMQDTINNSLQLMSENSNNTKQISDNLINYTNKMQQSLSEMLNYIKEVVEMSDSISQISEQTNLLQLNQQIEQQRQGDQGRGFSVIADEIRQLSSETKEITEKIKNKLNDLNEQSNITNNDVNQTIDNVNKNVNSIKVLTDEIDNAVKNIKQITDEINQIQENTNSTLETGNELQSQINNIQTYIEEIVNKTNEIDSEIGNQNKDIDRLKEQDIILKNTVEELTKIIQRFKIK